MTIKFSMEPKELIGIVEGIVSYGKKDLKSRKEDRRLESKKLDNDIELNELRMKNRELERKIVVLEDQINMGEGFARKK